MTHDNSFSPGIFKQFRHDGTLAYLFADRESRTAVLIDPVLEHYNDYREFLRDHELKLEWVLDTHLHADHYSATHLFAAETGAQIGMSERTQSERVTRRLKEGEEIRLGNLKLKTLLTPGHTPDSACFVGEGFVFTGDTVLIGATGRTDFTGSDPQALWSSLEHLKRELAGDALMFPGHDYQDLICSMWKTELKKNPHLLIDQESSFFEVKKDERVQTVPDEVQKRLNFNLAHSPVWKESSLGLAERVAQCGVVSVEEGENFGSIQVEKYQNKVRHPEEGLVYLDVRERDEFQEGHIPGTLNCPLSEIGFGWPKWSAASRIYLSCLSGRRSAMAAKTLSYLGLKDVVNVVGGFQAWAQAGYPVQKKSE